MEAVVVLDDGLRLRVEDGARERQEEQPPSRQLLAGIMAFSQHVCSIRLSRPSVMCEVLRRCTQDTNCELSCAALFQSRVTPRPCTIT